MPLCLKCRRLGHIRSACNTPFCRHCQKFGHLSVECQPSYAKAAKQTKHETPMPETLSEDTEGEGLFERCDEANAKEKARKEERPDPYKSRNQPQTSHSRHHN